MTFVKSQNIKLTLSILQIGIRAQLKVGGPLVISWTYVTDGALCWYRKGERLGMYVIDKSVDGGVTWELDLVVLDLTENSIIMTIDAGVAGYRQQIRGCVLYIDQELTLLGFAGAENTDWEWIYYT
jgi:hypothetical protein